MQLNEGRAPKVSVVTITYNHEAFIAQALEGILAQVTDFDVEVVVADDASTDATPHIVRDFAARHPGRIVPLIRPVNLGIHANFVDALSQSRGTYVALCEGDDYWTDPDKLQRQAELLDARPEVSLCAHPVVKTWEAGEEADSVWPDEDERSDTSFEALLRSNFIPTNSTLSRRLDDYTAIPDIMPLDWYLHLRHARKSAIAMLDEPMGVYRRHVGGVWYGSADDPEAFWVRQAPGMVAFTEAVMELVSEDSGHFAAMLDGALWVARNFAVRAREGDDDETAAILGANPRFAGLLARSFADRVDDVEWLTGQRDERDREIERLGRRLRRAKRKARRLAATDDQLPAPQVEQPDPVVRPRGRWSF